MRFTPQFLDELRARLPVSEVVGKRVKLKKAGKEFKGLSPFQQEKTPSFTVNDQKGFYHCFSSGKHGNVFDFLMETEGCSFPEAVERCAAMVGMALPQSSPDADRKEQRRRTLHDVMELAAKFFEGTLASKNGAKARGYLADRGIDPADAAEVPHGLRDARALRAEGASRRARHSGRGHGRGGPPDRRRGHPGPLRSLPRPRDVCRSPMCATA